MNLFDFVLKRGGPAFIFCLLISAFVFSPIQSQAVPTLPRALAAEKKVDEFHHLLIEVMKKGGGEACAFRYNLLLKDVRESFDMPLISNIVLGKWWRKISVDEKLNFIDVFTRYTASTYADRFNHYNNKRFVIISSELSRKDRALVETVLKSDGHEEVKLSYICRKSSTGWRIVSVSARGVNDLSLKRAEYNAYIEKYGFKTLVDMLDKKAAVCYGKK